MGIYKLQYKQSMYYKSEIVLSRLIKLLITQNAHLFKLIFNLSSLFLSKQKQTHCQNTIYSKNSFFNIYVYLPITQLKSNNIQQFFFSYQMGCVNIGARTKQTMNGLQNHKESINYSQSISQTPRIQMQIYQQTKQEANIENIKISQSSNQLKQSQKDSEIVSPNNRSKLKGSKNIKIIDQKTMNQKLSPEITHQLECQLPIKQPKQIRKQDQNFTIISTTKKDFIQSVTNITQSISPPSKQVQELPHQKLKDKRKKLELILKESNKKRDNLIKVIQQCLNQSKKLVRLVKQKLFAYKSNDFQRPKMQKQIQSQEQRITQYGNKIQILMQSNKGSNQWIMQLKKDINIEEYNQFRLLNLISVVQKGIYQLQKEWTPIYEKDLVEIKSSIQQLTYKKMNGI